MKPRRLTLFMESWFIAPPILRFVMTPVYTIRVQCGCGAGERPSGRGRLYDERRP
jgi:hypothetical protein